MSFDVHARGKRNVEKKLFQRYEQTEELLLRSATDAT